MQCENGHSGALCPVENAGLAAVRTRLIANRARSDLKETVV